MPEERKLVTILFADIVGSTAMGMAHDPEVVRKTLARTFGRLREVLTAHGRDALALIERTGYGLILADLRRYFASFLLSRSRAAEARALLEAARAFFADPLVGYQRERIDALLRRCDEVTAS